MVDRIKNTFKKSDRKTRITLKQLPMENDI